MTHDHDLVLRPTPAQITAALNPPPGRNGGDLVVETRGGGGATPVVGRPRQHAHGLVEAQRPAKRRFGG
ncbi:thiamine pyrophosphate-binding protein, partial [Streptomyces tricolor]